MEAGKFQRQRLSTDRKIGLGYARRAFLIHS
jgi:hypothetical protein